MLAAVLPVAGAGFVLLFIRARFRGLKLRVDLPQPLESRPGVKTMSEVVELLKEVRYRSSLPTRLATAIFGLVEAVPAALNSARITAGLVYPFPDVFEPVTVESADGTPVCGLVAMQPDSDERPALVVAHGLFGSKNSYGLQMLALKAFFDWGFHVFALDLRNFGDSSRFSVAPTTWGYRESDDILAAAEYMLSTNRVSTVGVCGVSMGASAALLAAGRSKMDRPLAGGVVALNGYADAQRAVERVSTVSRISVDSVAVWLAFKLLLLAKTAAEGPRPFLDLRSYTREVAAQYYEMGEHDLYLEASPVRTVAETEVPCLIIHSLDDPVVPIDEAYDLLAASIDNPMVDSLIVPSGGHALYEMVCPGWFFKTIEIFFTYWAEFGARRGQRAGRSPTETGEGRGTSD